MNRTGAAKSDPKAARLINVAVVLLVLKVVQSAVLVAKAQGVDIGFVPDVSSGEAFRTVALWLIAAWLVSRGHIAGWGMALTIAGVSIVTSLAADGDAAWRYFSLLGSAGVAVLLLTPPVVRGFVGPYMRRS